MSRSHHVHGGTTVTYATGAGPGATTVVTPAAPPQGHSVVVSPAAPPRMPVVAVSAPAPNRFAMYQPAPQPQSVHIHTPQYYRHGEYIYLDDGNNNPGCCCVIS